jgi:hypothetical protein
VTAEKDKTSADSDCKTYGGNLLTSKTIYSKYQVKSFLKDQDPVDNIYLGMSKDNEQWIWDDTKATAFSERAYFNICRKYIFTSVKLSMCMYECNAISKCYSFYCSNIISNRDTFACIALSSSCWLSS